jgi:hypothetical protein
MNKRPVAIIARNRRKLLHARWTKAESEKGILGRWHKLRGIVMRDSQSRTLIGDLAVVKGIPLYCAA